MKIAYLDLAVQGSMPGSSYEDYSLNPKRYGGGAVVARYGKELFNKGGDTFHVFASKDCFDNLTNKDNKAACIAIGERELDLVRKGAPLSIHIPELATYDVIMHHHDCLPINMWGLYVPLVHWALMGDGRANHGADYSLLYLSHERAQQGKTLYVQLGKPIPPYTPRVKEDFVFQCTRHDPHMNSIEVAQQCLKHGIKGYFAGPIAAGYDLMTYIDNKTTFYLGAIDEVTKLDHLSRATLVPLLLQWDTPFNQSAIEALSVGTPLLVNSRGFLKQLVREPENGLIWRGDLADSFAKAKALNPLMCRGSVERYSEVNMIDSFKMALKVALADWQLTHP